MIGTGDNRPIGVFDSGIGGLTVLKELAEQFPGESFIYLGDTARLPYGSKSPQTIRRYSEQNISFLARMNVKAIVIACNTASTQVPEPEMQGLPLYNVISPGAQRALQVSVHKRIGVLGTRATIASQAYTHKIHELDPKAKVFSQACPLFVPLAEEGWHSDPMTNLIVYRYLQKILELEIDTLILGCTHYPILKKPIGLVAGNGVELVDSGESIARWMADDFESGKLKKNTKVEGSQISIFTTDQSSHFNELALQILSPQIPDHFAVIDVS